MADSNGICRQSFRRIPHRQRILPACGIAIPESIRIQTGRRAARACRISMPESAGLRCIDIIVSAEVLRIRPGDHIVRPDGNDAGAARIRAIVPDYDGARARGAHLVAYRDRRIGARLCRIPDGNGVFG